MRVIETKVYKYDELNDEAKEKAVEKLYDINVQFDWWDCTYDDAESVGLKITGFDIGRGSSCDIDFTEDACFTAHKIKEEHGAMCETHQTAVNFLKERDEIVNTAPKDENGDFENEQELDEKLDDIEAEFLRSISEDYRIMLQKEYKYLTSEEVIIETIESNEYEFTEDGKLI